MSAGHLSNAGWNLAAERWFAFERQRGQRTVSSERRPLYLRDCRSQPVRVSKGDSLRLVRADRALILRRLGRS